MAIADEWEQRIVEADATDAVKMVNAERVMPPMSRPVSEVPVPRSLRTPLIDRPRDDPDSVDPAALGPEVVAATRAGGGHEFLPFAGQSAGLVHEILPGAEIIRRMVEEAERALAVGFGWCRASTSSPSRPRSRSAGSTAT